MVGVGCLPRTGDKRWSKCDVAISGEPRRWYLETLDWEARHLFHDMLFGYGIVWDEQWIIAPGVSCARVMFGPGIANFIPFTQKSLARFFMPLQWVYTLYVLFSS